MGRPVIVSVCEPEGYAMGDPGRLQPLEAAERFVAEHFPDCDGGVLGGSVLRGEATDTSDLDIVIFDDRLPSAYRESMVEFGWPIEVFVHNLTSYRGFFESDRQRARPALARMVSEGVVLKDAGAVEAVRQEARDLLDDGPEPWSDETLQMSRYYLTDALDDFIGCDDRAEGIFIAGALAEAAHEFVLRANGQWVGASKWILRALKHYDERFAEEYAEAFDRYYRCGNKEPVVELVDRVLQPHGGRLFDGFKQQAKM